MKKFNEYWQKPISKKVAFVLSLITFCIALHYFAIATTFLSLAGVLVTGLNALIATKRLSELEKEYISKQKAKRYTE